LGEGFLNGRQIEKVVQTLQQDLIRFAPRLARIVPDFSSRFAPLLKTYSQPFLVRKLRSDGAFAVGPGRQITFNATSFRLFHDAIDRLERSCGIPGEMAVIAHQIAVEQLVVHELTHVSVGLVHFTDVQKFKGVVGVNALGELDLIADVTAARICARLEMFRAQEKGSMMYGSRFLQQLFVMGNFAFPAFGAPASKFHKRQRFLGLAMIAARAQNFLGRASCKSEDGEFAMDTPLYPHLDDAREEILISAFDPDRVLWGGSVKVDSKLLKLTCDDLDSVPFAVSIARAGKLLHQMGRLKGPVSMVTENFNRVGRAAG
jgi:hypothetical protein